MGRISEIPLSPLVGSLATGRRAFPALLTALLLIGSLALVACGGGGGDTTEPSGQEATPSGGEAAPAAPTPTSGGLTPTGTFTEEDLILPESWESFEVDLVAGDFVRATYTSKPKAVGGFAESGALGRPGLIFNVNDPIGDSIYQGEQVADGGTDFTAALNGTYEFTFFNPVVRNLQEVKLEYTINP